MAFTRKHYNTVADILNGAHQAYGVPGNPFADQAQHGAIDHVARRLADVFAQDNPRFDPDRFHKAAGTSKR